MKITPSNELKHICKILESCENEGQIQTTERMFKNFVNKWKNKVDNVDLTGYIINFNLELEDKKNQICYLQ
jgi:hypothetical protein